MHVLVLIIWIVSLAVFAIDTARLRPEWNLTSLGLFAFDLWIGLHMIIAGGDRITWDL